jgi:2-iminoacetate synthase ThiH
LLALLTDVVTAGGSRVELRDLYLPELDLESYLMLIERLCASFPLEMYAFTPEDITRIAEANHESCSAVLKALQQAGLRGIAGDFEASSERVTQLHELAHSFRLETQARVVLHPRNSWKEIIAILSAVRSIQDHTRGFRWLSLIPMTESDLQKESFPLEDYFRLIAVARIYLDCFEHISCSINAFGLNVGMYCLQNGADAFGEVFIHASGVENLKRAYQSTRRCINVQLAAHGYEITEEDAAETRFPTVLRNRRGI